MKPPRFRPILAAAILLAAASALTSCAGLAGSSLSFGPDGAATIVTPPPVTPAK
jgi:hypothetical protein